MYRFVSAITLAIFFSITVLRLTEAAQVEKTPVDLVQPDGKKFKAQPFGDEWYSGYEHNEFTILQDQAGTWRYAVRQPDGSLQPSTIAVGVGRSAPEGTSRHLRDQVRLANVPRQNLGRSVANWSGTFGSQPLLVILVDFTPSTSLGSTSAQWNEAFFATDAGAKSVSNFYSQASYGAFTVEPAQETHGDVDDGIIAVTLNRPHPNTAAHTTSANRILTADALIAADPFIDYASYDLDGSGGIDVNELHLFIIPRGYETSYGGASAACSPSVWGHRWSLNPSETPQLDGMHVAGVAWGGGYMQFGEWHDTVSGSGCPGSAEGNMATIGIMAHELGHDINWPDLYDVDGSTRGVGYWSVMAGGSWGSEAGEPAGTTPILPDAFSKIYQRWITPTVISGTQSAISVPNSAENQTVFQLGDNPAGVDWLFNARSGEGEYFLVENRQQIGFDSGLARVGPDVNGLLIWHIDESAPFDNYTNADENARLVDVVEANHQQDMEVSSSNSGDGNDIWPGSNNLSSFNAASLPNSNWHNGNPSGVSVENIALSRSVMSADFTSTDVLPTSVRLKTTDLHQQADSRPLLVIVLVLTVLTISSKRKSQAA